MAGCRASASDTELDMLQKCTENDPSGSVTMEVQGTEEQISNVIIAVERGTYIRIEDMKVKTIPVHEIGLLFIYE